MAGAWQASVRLLVEACQLLICGRPIAAADQLRSAAASPPVIQGGFRQLADTSHLRSRTALPARSPAPRLQRAKRGSARHPPSSNTCSAQAVSVVTKTNIHQENHGRHSLVSSIQHLFKRSGYASSSATLSAARAPRTCDQDAGAFLFFFGRNFGSFFLGAPVLFDIQPIAPGAAISARERESAQSRSQLYEH